MHTTGWKAQTRVRSTIAGSQPNSNRWPASSRRRATCRFSSAGRDATIPSCCTPSGRAATAALARSIRACSSGVGGVPHGRPLRVLAAACGAIHPIRARPGLSELIRPYSQSLPLK